MISLQYSNTDQRGDLSRSTGKNLDTDAGLETAVTTSLFSDARAKDSDSVDGDKRGWWGESYLDQPGQYGSRLWLLSRGKLTTQALLDFSDYAKEALQWMIDAGVAKTVEASAERLAGTRDVGVLTVKITRPSKAAPRFERAWKVQFGI